LNGALVLKHRFTAGYEQWYFLQADVHFDSPECTRRQYFRHLRQARERNAPIIDVGDFLDVISSRMDKRMTKSTARPEDASDGAYLDGVTDRSARELSEYADQFVYIGDGNHNLKLLKMYETDLNRHLVEKLTRYRSAGLPPIYKAGYGGWIVFTFEHESGGRRKNVKMKLFHGAGGGGEVTKGTMEAQRMLATIGNADIVVTGHIHEKWNVDLVQERLNVNTFRAEFAPRQHLKLGSYKVDYRLDGKGTWHMQRPGGTPKPLGGCWLRFFADRSGGQLGIQYQLIKADVDYSDLFDETRSTDDDEAMVPGDSGSPGLDG
jgi:UDP-2,3-diacylglucosamine pyrophosphatase LpxH